MIESTNKSLCSRTTYFVVHEQHIVTMFVVVSDLSLNGLEIVGRTIKVGEEMTKEFICIYSFYICESNCFSVSVFNYPLNNNPCCFSFAMYSGVASWFLLFNSGVASWLLLFNMVPLVERKYVARTILAFVAKGTYIVISFTLVRKAHTQKLYAFLLGNDFLCIYFY